MQVSPTTQTMECSNSGTANETDKGLSLVEQISKLKAKIAAFEKTNVPTEHQARFAIRVQKMTEEMSKWNKAAKGKRPFPEPESNDPLAYQRIEGEVKRRKILDEAGEKVVEASPTPKPVVPLNPLKLSLQKTYASLEGSIQKIVMDNSGKWCVIYKRGQYIAIVTKDGVRDALWANSDFKANDIISHNSSFLVSYEDSGIMRRYSKEDFAFQNTIDFEDALTKLHQYNNQLLIGDKKGGVHLCDTDGKIIKTRTVHGSYRLTSFAMSDEYIVSGSSDRHCSIFAKEQFINGQGRLKYINMITTVTALSIDGPIVYAGTLKGFLKIMNIKTGVEWALQFEHPIVEIIADDQGFYLASEKQIIYCFKPNEQETEYKQHVIYNIEDNDTILSMSKSEEQIAFGLASGKLRFLITSETAV